MTAAQQSETPRVDALRKALEHIADPIAWEKAHVETGYDINWPMLMRMLESPQYYIDIAKEALKNG